MSQLLARSLQFRTLITQHLFRKAEGKQAPVTELSAEKPLSVPAGADNFESILEKGRATFVSRTNSEDRLSVLSIGIFSLRLSFTLDRVSCDIFVYVC